MSDRLSDERPPADDEAPPRRGRPLLGLIVALALVGLALSVWLQIEHARAHASADYRSATCSMAEGFDCVAVARSPYAVALGLPVALWGVLGYMSMALLALRGLATSRPSDSWPFGVLSLLGVFASLVGAALFVVSKAAIGSVCPVCAATYPLNFAIAAVAIVGAVKHGPLVTVLSEEASWTLRYPHPLLQTAAPMLGAVVALEILLPKYWAKPPHPLEIPAGSAPSASAAPVVHARGVTEDGAPWIGAEKPELTIVEFSDYECPFCREGHAALEEALRRYGTRLRLVHRHFPLDQACNKAMERPLHAHACAYARLATCAAEQQKFWEANHYLFVNGGRTDQVNARELGREVGLDAAKLEACIAGTAVAEAVARDLAAGAEVGVDGTPAFLIDGRVVGLQEALEIIVTRFGR